MEGGDVFHLRSVNCRAGWEEAWVRAGKRVGAIVPSCPFHPVCKEAQLQCRVYVGGSAWEPAWEGRLEGDTG